MAQQMARKRIFVNGEIQGNILRRLAKYWIIYHLGIWFILFSIDLLPHIIGGIFNNDWVSVQDFSAKFVQKHFVILTLPILLFPAIFWGMLQLTHKIAGPLVRFRNSLRNLAAGRLVEKIKLRDGDLMTELQQAFNEFLDSDRLRFVQSSTYDAKSEVLKPSGVHSTKF